MHISEFQNLPSGMEGNVFWFISLDKTLDSRMQCLSFVPQITSIFCDCRLRELTTSEIGRLVSVTGVVTRTSEVRPELLQGTFKCLECGTLVKNVEQQFKYSEVSEHFCICTPTTHYSYIR